MTQTLEVLLDHPPEAGAITRVYMWVGLWPGGREAILGAAIGPADAQVPLITSRRELAERMGGLAQQICRLSQQGDHPMTSVELRTFVVETN